MKLNLDKQDLGLWAIAMLPFAITGMLFAISMYSGFTAGN